MYLENLKAIIDMAYCIYRMKNEGEAYKKK